MAFARPRIKTPNWFSRRFLGINNNPYSKQLTIPGFNNSVKNAKRYDKYKGYNDSLDKYRTGGQVRKWLQGKIASFRARREALRQQKAFAKNYQLASDRFNIMQDSINNYKYNIPVNPPAQPAPVGFQRTRKKGYSQNPPAPVGFQRTRKKGYSRIELSRYFDLAEFSSPFYTRRITLGMIG